MPDGSNLKNDPAQDAVAWKSDIMNRTNRAMALVAALDLMEENDDAFKDQKDIRLTLTAMAFDEVRALQRLAAI
jgi:hypothetical protein